LILWVSLLTSPLAGKTPAVSALGPGYAPALAAADHLLQAWQSGDVENGMSLLTSHAKEAATTDVVEKFFSNAESSGYEIGRGKLVKRGRYEFPVVLVTEDSKKLHARRRFSSIIVVNTGNNDWAVDKLP
jgi:nickel-dependent lactate racemase